MLTLYLPEGKGELIVETAVFYNAIRAAVRTFSPKEEIILKDPAKFDISLLQRDVKRITAQVNPKQNHVFLAFIFEVSSSICSHCVHCFHVPHIYDRTKSLKCIIS